MNGSGIGIGILCLAAAAGAEDYTAWAHSRDLTVDASPAGANTSTVVAGFPLALSLGPESADLFAQAKPDGADLRFAAQDGAHLPYQIEAWDAVSGKGLVWVRLPSVPAGQVLTLRAHWGNPSAADSSNGPAVFRSQDGFQGVWHLGSLADASSNGITALDSGTAADAAGRLGAARRFPNTDAYAAKGAYLALGNPAALNLKGIITLEAWVKWERRDGHRIIICHGAAPGMGQAAQYETVLRIGETLDYRAGVWTGAAHYAAADVPPSDSAAWVLLGGVYDGSKWTLYRNGARLAATAADTNGAKPSTGSWRIGAEYANGVTRYFAGSLDEVRVSSAARTEDWFKLAYATQKEGQTAVKWAGPTALRARLRPSAGRGKSFGGATPVFRRPGKAGRVDATGAALAW
jgi:hypothetical protein